MGEQRTVYSLQPGAIGWTIAEPKLSGRLGDCLGPKSESKSTPSSPSAAAARRRRRGGGGGRAFIHVRNGREGRGEREGASERAREGQKYNSTEGRCVPFCPLMSECMRSTGALGLAGFQFSARAPLPLPGLR